VPKLRASDCGLRPAFVLPMLSACRRILENVKTLHGLILTYGTTEIPLAECCDLFGLGLKTAKERALCNRLPVPAYRIGSSSKAPFLVSAEALATYIDDEKRQALADWTMAKG